MSTLHKHGADLRTFTVYAVMGTNSIYSPYNLYGDAHKITKRSNRGIIFTKSPLTIQLIPRKLRSFYGIYILQAHSE